MFHRFESRLSYSGRLITTGPLRIGAGKESDVDAPDLAVVRDVTGKPYVPGSTIKGVLRGYVESLVRGINEESACDPTDFDRCCLNRRKTRNLFQEHRRSARALAEAIEAGACLICSVFGSHSMASRIALDDLRPEGWFGQFQNRHGVAIDRDTGRAADNKLFDFEVVPAGTVFHLRLTLDNGHDWQRGLVVIAIRAMQSGQITVGAGRSRGFGSVSIEAGQWQLIASPDEQLEILDSGAPALGKPVSEDSLAEWVGALRKRLQEVTVHA